ncbi:MAG: anti-sigma factor family protein [Gemmatimonadales bacterium]
MTMHWTERLSDYIDEELSPAERDACEAHLLACAECREVLGELRVIVAEARELPDEEPARELWPGIQPRLDTPPLSIERSPARAPVRRRVFALSVPQLAAAALACAVIGGGGALLASGAFRGGSSTPVATLPPSVAPVMAPAALLPGQAAYDHAVADLRAVLEAGKSRLKPETIAVLEENLATIDRAIERSRKALEADPGNPYLNAHVQAAMRRKLEVLRRAADLVSAES